jgi:hypothetical protein
MVHFFLFNQPAIKTHLNYYYLIYMKVRLIYFHIYNRLRGSAQRVLTFPVLSSSSL